MTGRPRNPERTKRDCQHPLAQHRHGTFLGYIADRCRCTPCTDANSAYADNRRRNIAYGRWGKGFTDAEPVREHVTRLRSHGMGLNSIAVAAGVSKGSLARLIYGEKGGPPSRQITVRVATAVLAVRPTVESMLAGTKIPATGTRRRLQALASLGYTNNRLSRELDCTAQHVHYLLHAQGRVTAANARRVTELYDRLWRVIPKPATKWEAGGVRRAKDTARAHGWVPPLLWDDDQIDDPTATPHVDDYATRVRGRPAADIAEDVAWFLDDEPLATAQRVADRLRLTRNHLQITLKRAERHDLLDQLARNARLNQEGTAA
jgi:hypothetical protein